MKEYRMFVAALALGFCVGCAGDHDPRTGGFFGGMAGLSSGSYEKRVKDREARLEELRATQRELDAESTQLEQQKSDAMVRVEQDRQDVAALQSDIAALEKKTKALSTQQGQNSARVKDLQGKVATLKSKMNKQASELDALEGSGLGDKDVDLRRKQLESQRDSLRKEFDLLMKMQTELAQ